MAMAKALDFLLELIDSGVEYPDAEYRASARYKVHPLELQEAYDDWCNQQEGVKHGKI